ncbi:hypothetical protein N658DRAFT_187744 [Parathielavia hyrcaniae]|uniref:Uncharacterized protein n=1 Tax=Parathielavia hyrcaniae TaxID=113614 RepID=A0AAN6Q9L7_9PEZI|nr:hypothetical protein N658DRAFT_187744 [Parathielavia hyrcaniae]
MTNSSQETATDGSGRLHLDGSPVFKRLVVAAWAPRAHRADVKPNQRSLHPHRVIAGIKRVMWGTEIVQSQRIGRLPPAASARSRTTPPFCRHPASFGLRGKTSLSIFCLDARGCEWTSGVNWFDWLMYSCALSCFRGLDWSSQPHAASHANEALHRTSIPSQSGQETFIVQHFHCKERIPAYQFDWRRAPGSSSRDDQILSGDRIFCPRFLVPSLRVRPAAVDSFSTTKVEPLGQTWLPGLRLERAAYLLVLLTPRRLSFCRLPGP